MTSAQSSIKKILGLYSKSFILSHIVKYFATNKPALIFLIAFLIRFSLGFIFFGSIDTYVHVRDSINLIDGGRIDSYPYFPSLHFILYFSAILNAYSPLPLTVCYKLSPIIFDSLIAVLIFKITAREKTKNAFKIALMYALCPVCIILASFHGQWDALCLFFLIAAFYIRDYTHDRFEKFIFFGILICMSILIKPYTAVFMVIFFRPLTKLNSNEIKKYLYNSIFSVLGFIITFSVFLLLYKSAGYDIFQTINRILEYSKGGIQHFGLPFSKYGKYIPFNNRFWLISVTIFFSLLYYFRKVKSFELILLFFALSIGTTGLLVQYLLWTFPFLFICRKLRFCAYLNLITMPFVLLWYINPFASKTLKSECMATFATLKPFSWLMPPKFFTTENWVGIIRLFGDYIIPLSNLYIFLYFVFLIAKRLIQRKQVTHITPKKSKVGFFGLEFSKFVFLYWGIILGVFSIFKLAAKPKALVSVLSSVNNVKYNAYDIEFTQLRLYAGNFKDFSLSNTFNIIFIFAAITIIWSTYVYLFALKRSSILSETQFKLSPKNPVKESNQ